MLSAKEMVLELSRSDLGLRNRDLNGSWKISDYPQTQNRIKTTRLRMRLNGADPSPEISGVEELPGKISYLIGRAPVGWRTKIPIFSRVRYGRIYKGVDMVVYGNHRLPEYDFVVKPGAGPKIIEAAFHGSRKITLGASGSSALLRSFDSAGAWASIDKDIADKVVLSLAVDPVNPSTIYAGTQRGRIQEH